MVERCGMTVARLGSRLPLHAVRKRRQHGSQKDDQDDKEDRAHWPHSKGAVNEREKRFEGSSPFLKLTYRLGNQWGFVKREDFTCQESPKSADSMRRIVEGWQLSHAAPRERPLQAAHRVKRSLLFARTYAFSQRGL